MSRAGLARAAGLHANTLRDCSEPGWNPTAETLAKIERFLSENDATPVLVPIEEMSVVTAPYEVDGEVVGTLGVIGPTRMAYERVIPIVDITAKLLSNALSQH